jgi:adenylosuccinate synthase
MSNARTVKPFRVLIDLKLFPKATKCFRITEEYETWTEADTAFEHWHKLASTCKSVVEFVELSEERVQRTHKTSKEKRTKLPTNVTPILAGVSNGYLPSI